MIDEENTVYLTPKNKNIGTITLEEVLDLFSY